MKGPAAGDCWLWAGAVSDDGYGRFSLNHGAYGVELDGFGPLMHACDVPICVRATAGSDTHFGVGDPRLNMLDRLAKNRDTNGSNFRWRGLARRHFAQQSRVLRDEVNAYGWSREERVVRFWPAPIPTPPHSFR